MPPWSIMNIIVVVLVFIISAVTSYQIIVKKNQDQKEILSVSSSSTESFSPAPTPKPSSTPASTPTSKPTPSSNNSQVAIPSQIFNLSDFKYPNSSQAGSEGNGIKLESSDNPDTVTNWYKEKIRSLGFKSKSFVQTSSNGNILNKLVAASENKEIRVEIEKSANSAKVLIKVSLIAKQD